MGTAATSEGAAVSGFTGLSGSFVVDVETGGRGSPTITSPLPLVNRLMVDWGMCFPAGRVTGAIKTVLAGGRVFGGDAETCCRVRLGDSGFAGLSGSGRLGSAFIGVGSCLPGGWPFWVTVTTLEGGCDFGGATGSGGSNFLG